MIAGEITRVIIEKSIVIHERLGPGLLENVYEVILAHELQAAGLAVRRQHPFPVVYDDICLDAGYRIDILVENQVVVEVKSVEMIAPVHEAQLLTYLKLAGFRVGLLINFNTRLLKEGIRRFVNGY